MSLSGTIYLSDKGNIYIYSQEDNSYYLLLDRELSPISKKVINCYNIEGKVINMDVMACSFESFKEFILRHKLYQQINENQINNKNI